MKKFYIFLLLTTFFIVNSFLFFSNSTRAQITDGLVGYWNLDSTAGSTVSDVSGNGNTGIVNGGGTWTNGKINGAFKSDGNTSYILVPDSPSTNVTGAQISVSFWVYLNSTTGRNTNIIQKYSNNGGYVVSLSSSSYLEFYIYNGTNYVIAGTSEISAGRWMHVVGMYDSTSGIKLYIDGVLKNSHTANGTINSSAGGNLYMARKGWNGVNDNYLDGSIDDVRIYNRALSVAEITDIYNYIGVAIPPVTPPVTPTTCTSFTYSVWSICSSGNQSRTITSFSPTGCTGGNPQLTQSCTVTPPITSPAIYYISSSAGNDSNNGLSPGTPWKTIAKVNSTGFKPGDTIMFNRGDIWREQLNVPSSGSSGLPITYDAYGSGSLPIISGANTVTGWTQYSGNIYVANVGAIINPSQLYVDGSFYDIAHYPDSGYLIATANSLDTTSIIDSNLTLSANQIVGATVVAKAVPWHLSATIATAYDPSAHVITLNSNIYGSRNMRTDYGFYLQNMLWMLNSPGEWFYDQTAGKIYLWTKSSDNPANHIVEITNRQYGIFSSGKNYLTIQNLAITNSNQYGVYISGIESSTLNNLSISGGAVGVYFNGSGSNGINNTTIQNSSIQNTFATGIAVNYKAYGVNILNNTISNNNNVSSVPHDTNLGVYTSNSSIYLTGETVMSNINIRNNTITNSGYNGIHFGGNLITVENNTIDHSCMILDDCGGIYTSSNPGLGTGPLSNNIIRGNTVTNTIGNFEGTAYSKYNLLQSEGIYLDAVTYTTQVLNNTVINTGDSGIYSNDGHDNIIIGNGIYGAKRYGLQIVGGSFTGAVGLAKNNIITGNNFESNMVNGMAVYFQDTYESNLVYGTFDYNQYCDLNSQNNAINTLAKKLSTDINLTNINFTLPAWQIFSGQDANSKYINGPCPKTFLSSSSTVTPPIYIVGDFDQNNLVNSIDLSLLISAWNTNNSIYDLNHDGIVNSLDYVIMVQNWTMI